MLGGQRQCCCPRCRWGPGLERRRSCLGTATAGLLEPALLLLGQASAQAARLAARSAPLQGVRGSGDPISRCIPRVNAGSRAVTSLLRLPPQLTLTMTLLAVCAGILAEEAFVSRQERVGAACHCFVRGMNP
jgi:hypothetical protein